MTATLPPGARCDAKRSRKAASDSSSRFTAIRSAWNTRVAGWIDRGHAFRGMADLTRSASWAVRSTGSFRLRSTIARAIRLENLSSPNRKKMSASSRSVDRLRISRASLPPAPGSRRMSTGPSPRKQNPPEGAAGETFRRRRKHRGVGIRADEQAGRAYPFRDPFRVPAPARRPVEEYLSGNGSQQSQRLLEKNGDVAVRHTLYPQGIDLPGQLGILESFLLEPADFPIPSLPVPDLEPVRHPDDDDIPAEPRVGTERGGDQDPSLLVGRDLAGPAHEEPHEGILLPVDARHLGRELLFNPFPLLRRIGIDAVLVVRYHDGFLACLGELITEAGRG